MGIFWDLLQQSELDTQKGKAESIEEHSGKDINEDGIIG